jgi:hypothetical protein
MAYVPRNDSPDNVYLNVRIDHNQNSGQESSPAYINVTKNQPYINRASDYYVSVLSCTVPLNNCPLWIASIVPNQGNPNLMTSAVTIETNLGIQPMQNLIYQPSSDQFPAPIQNKPVEVVSPYYYSDSYDSYISSFNIALAAAYALAYPLATDPPYIYLDEGLQLLVLVVSKAFRDLATNKIRINSDAYNYLIGFRFKKTVTIPNAPYAFVLDDFGNVCNEFGGNQRVADADWLFYPQQYYSLESWTPLRKIIITSVSLPILSEYLATATGNNPQAPVLLDFSPQIRTGSEARTITFYVATAQYRLVDLISNDNISNVSIQIYWGDRIGNIYPLLISAYQSVDLKLGFFKKHLLKN